MAKSVSITKLCEYAQNITAERKDDDIIEISMTRGTAQWILDDLAKRGKRLQQSVDDTITRFAKKERRKRELDQLAVAVDAINKAITN